MLEFIRVRVTDGVVVVPAAIRVDQIVAVHEKSANTTTVILSNGKELDVEIDGSVDEVLACIEDAEEYYSVVGD